VEYIGYSTPNTASLELLDEEISSNPIAYPGVDVIKNAQYFVELPNELNKGLDAGWKVLLTDSESFTYWLVPVLLLIAVIASVLVVMRKSAKKKRGNY
ncbi:MAG: spermidine/putrescine ABC transporter substrate-binding protein, partial [Oscillospiraceae bacterium]